MGVKINNRIQLKKKYWNNQKYSECQLIALWNSAIYHNIPLPVRYGTEYIKDCEMAFAINGGAINTNLVIKKLGLTPKHGQLKWNWIKKNCPIEFKIFCHRGYHSVLAVDVDYENKRILLANYAFNRLHWMKVEKIIEKHNKTVKPIKWLVETQ